jgi:L-arabinokinase
MWRFEQPPPCALPDVKRFLDVLNRQADFFVPDEPIRVARAPGRLDLMGGIADYSGALVLALPLAAATFVAAQPVPTPYVAVQTTAATELGVEPRVSLPLLTLTPANGPLSYTAAHQLLAADVRRGWAAYVFGALVALQREHAIRPATGLRLLVHSEVPPGAGVSSSAALEVAALRALCAVCAFELDGREAALLCQKVENLVVGAPCGVMDQMTAACGEQDRLFALLCQPAEPERPVPLPPEIEVWGIGSGFRHAVSGADYGAVRVGAFMGYRIIAEQAGLAVTPVAEGRVDVVDPRWRGYLANIPPSLWEGVYRDHVPVALAGQAFLDRYIGLPDAVTQVEPARTYAVRQPTAHPIYEHHRVQAFRALLQARPLGDEHLRSLDELMYQSHASYSACGLASDGTDRIVELVRRAGSASGLYGAKITGGGSGGTVAVLARRGAADVIRRIAAEYERETGRPASVLGGSSPGALRFGVPRLIPC